MDDKYRDELIDNILIGPWQKATFKIKLIDFFFEIEKGADIYQELEKMKTKKVYIICDDNRMSICHKDIEGLANYDVLRGGHHFGHHYATLSKLIGKRLSLE